MPGTTVLNVKIDKTLKRQAQELAKAIGLPMSTVVATNLREFVRSRSITLNDHPRLNPDVERELLQLERDVKKRKDLSPSFKSAESALAWLHRQD